MKAELYTDPAAFDTLRAEWADLLARSTFDTLFLRPEWLGAWWQVFGPEGALRLIAVRDDAGRLVGLAPLFLAEVAADASAPLPAMSFERPRPEHGAARLPALLLVGGTEVSDYLDCIVDPAQAPAVYEAIVATLEQQVPGWAWLDLHGLPEASPTPGALAGLARDRGLAVALGQEDVCPVVALPETWEAYLATLGKKQRHELRRKMRNIAQAGPVRLVEARDPAELEGHLQTFIALHEASTPDKADFMRDPRMRRFFGLVARMALENGWLDLSFLALGDELAATMFCFRYRGAELVYNSGFNPQAWPGLSPGIVLLGRCIQRAIEAGLREFDFLQGDERYKYDFGARDRAVQRLLIRRG
ncbi:MAG TPA: GNAT family N-acetyltransferase [Anaerolineae bacterium]|nr:GNAT family N-acetyltransferase [Anaerolineae bacterium]HOQ97728.1 GNAT family N-acetyltransferase [Anaerolineae bacterium]HPL27298.1 GNAT family N-acetyltransferase [Anaerolineae bacterium]